MFLVQRVENRILSRNLLSRFFVVSDCIKTDDSFVTSTICGYVQRQVLKQIYGPNRITNLHKKNSDL